MDWEAEIERASLSPRGLVSGILEHVDDIELVVVAYVLRDGTINVGHSWAEPDEGGHGSLEIIGLLETAKHQVLTDQQDAL